MTFPVTCILVCLLVSAFVSNADGCQYTHFEMLMWQHVAVSLAYTGCLGICQSLLFGNEIAGATVAYGVILASKHVSAKKQLRHMDRRFYELSGTRSWRGGSHIENWDRAPLGVP